MKPFWLLCTKNTTLMPLQSGQTVSLSEAKVARQIKYTPTMDSFGDFADMDPYSKDRNINSGEK
jgi:hypothetical protein